MENLKFRLAKLLAALNISAKNLPTSQGIQIYNAAVKCINTDASPADLAPDELGCAETLSDIIRFAGFNFPVIVSTRQLYDYFYKSEDWVQVDSPLAGDVILSPTGFGGKNGITNGHTGIVGLNGVVMSNSSATGTFERNYTLQSWKERYAIKGGYPIYYFRKI